MYVICFFLLLFNCVLCHGITPSVSISFRVCRFSDAFGKCNKRPNQPNIMCIKPCSLFFQPIHSMNELKQSCIWIQNNICNIIFRRRRIIHWNYYLCDPAKPDSIPICNWFYFFIVSLCLILSCVYVCVFFGISFWFSSIFYEKSSLYNEILSFGNSTIPKCKVKKKKTFQQCDDSKHSS